MTDLVTNQVVLGVLFNVCPERQSQDTVLHVEHSSAHLVLQDRNVLGREEFGGD